MSNYYIGKAKEETLKNERLVKNRGWNLTEHRVKKVVYPKVGNIRFFDESEVNALTQNYEIWIEHLVSNGAELDNDIDSILDEVILSDKVRVARNALKKLCENRKDIRCFEIDVEEFMEMISSVLVTMRSDSFI